VIVDIAALPYIDEHTTVIEASPGTVWSGLGDVLDRTFSGPGMARYSRMVGSADRTAAGPRPPVVGSTFPGFRVVAAIPERELVLTGSHRFSSYALIFRLEPDGPGRTRLRAESRGHFPGLAGGVYRALVIRTGGHVIGMRRMLASVRRRSEG
jgi:hypothetical protein